MSVHRSPPIFCESSHQIDAAEAQRVVCEKDHAPNAAEGLRVTNGCAGYVGRQSASTSDCRRSAALPRIAAAGPGCV